MTRLCWLLVMLMAGGWQVEAKGRTSFVTAVGAAGTDSFAFGIELWAVSQIELLPREHFGLEPMEVHSESDRFRHLDDGQADFALVRADIPTPFKNELKSIMTLWPDGVRKIDTEATHLIVHADTPENVVYLVTRTIFEEAEKLQSSRETMGVGLPRDALAGLALPLHPGAHRYYEEVGLGSGLDGVLALHQREVVPSQSATSSVRLLKHEALQLAAACRQAAASGVLDYEERDVLSEACLTYAPGVIVPTAPSHGLDGPKLSIRRSGADRHIWTSGLAPTM